MIISRTPFRISFFGGGTDFPKWYKHNGGKTISTTINKFSYISSRKLPPFFKYKYRFRYHKKEEVIKISQIKHPSIRETLKYLKYSENFELVHHADLPAQSGLGASSSFTVGLINTIYALQGKRISKKNLALTAIDIEQNKIKEGVGSQDQIAAAFGGFNITDYKKGSFEVKPVTAYSNIKKLEDSILLVFTGHPRMASIIEKTKIKKINFNHKYYQQILNITNQAEDKIYTSKNIVNDFAELMDQYWWNKKKLSNEVTNKKIDNILKLGIKNGAKSGKLLGAGGGGFIMFLVDNKKKDKLIKAFENYIIVPIKFEKNGTQIIYYQDLN